MRIFPALLCAALVGAVPPALAQDSAPTLGGSLQPAPPDPDAPPAPSPPPVETEMTAVPELTGGWILEKTNFRDRVFVALDGMAGAETVTILDGKQWLGTGRWWAGSPPTIRLEELDVICVVLECSPSDLMVPEPEKVAARRPQNVETINGQNDTPPRVAPRFGKPRSEPPV